jgi:hypothetical protein
MEERLVKVVKFITLWMTLVVRLVDVVAVWFAKTSPQGLD